MKYYSRLKQYKASNVMFDETTKEAFSYEWWRFVAPLQDGTLIFNTGRYSTTTDRHQSKVRKLLQELGYTVIEVDFDNNNLTQSLRAVIMVMEGQCRELQRLIDNPRTRGWANEKRIRKRDKKRKVIAQLVDKLSRGYDIFT